MNLTILGAGAWGTALAANVAPHHPTVLWTRDADQAARLHAERSNARYLPGVALPASLVIDTDFAAAVAHARDGLVVVGTPMAGLADMLARLRGASAGIFWLCKGFQQDTGRLGHEVAAAVLPGVPVGVLSGPSFAIEVARGQPTALVAASRNAALAERAVEAFHADNLRIYTSDDPVGVEVGGAVKNVLAIATGIADGMSVRNGREGGGGDGRLGLGLNARAALVTRGLAEMSRLGVALGAHPETFMGLSGLGDLVLTATGDLSRNRQVGQWLAAGKALPQILAELGHVAEGVSTAPMVLRRAREVGVEMPIAEAVVAVLDGSATPARALERLMGRDARREA